MGVVKLTCLAVGVVDFVLIALICAGVMLLSNPVFQNEVFG